jgi:hypothetical protein
MRLATRIGTGMASFFKDTDASAWVYDLGAQKRVDLPPRLLSDSVPRFDLTLLGNSERTMRLLLFHRTSR